eukprot:11227476-Lingulodinium_polyedra.AAC.1
MQLSSAAALVADLVAVLTVPGAVVAALASNGCGVPVAVVVVALDVKARERESDRVRIKMPTNTGKRVLAKVDDGMP